MTQVWIAADPPLIGRITGSGFYENCGKWKYWHWMQQWHHGRDSWVWWWNYETIFILTYARLDTKVVCFWCQIYLFMMWIRMKFDVDYVYFWLGLWWYLLFFISMWCLYINFVLQALIFHKERNIVKLINSA